MTDAFEKALAEQCAPTLAGVKAASLFRIGGEVGDLRRAALHWDRLLTSFGIRLRVLKMCPAAQACMIYVYRRDWLDCILAQPEVRGFLLQMGYCPADTESLLDQLARRFCLEEAYPHEIGIFLGYPLEDVEGFIRHRGRNFTCCGQWKCYGDPAAAQACFARLRACTSAYKRLYESGIPITKLIVAA